MASRRLVSVSAVSNAEKCRKWRQLKKGDPDYLENEKLRKAEFRSRMTPEQTERSRQLARERMRKHRKRKREEMANELQSPSPPPKRVLTRQMKETQRKKWRIRKQIYRSKLSGQKKRRIREKEATAKREKRQNLQKPKKTEKQSSAFSTDGAKRAALFRSRKHLPKDPEKFVVVVKGIIDRSSPKKRKLLSSQKIILTPSKRKRINLLEKNVESLKSTYKALKSSRTATCTKQRRHLVHNMAKTLKKHKTMLRSCQDLGIRYKTMLKWSTCAEESRKRRSDVLEWEDDIKDFYVKPYISVFHAEKNTVKEDQQRQTLNQSLQDTYNLFKSEHPNKHVSFSKFAKLKPSHVKTVDKQSMRACLCEKCVNIELLLKAMNKEFPAQKINNRYEASKLTLCNYEKQAKLECVQRTCKYCGVESGLKDYKAEDEREVTWYRWQTVKVSNKKTNKDLTKKALVSHTGSLRDLLREFADCLKTFAMHIFEASWQYRQFSKLRENLPEGVLLCVLDFAENYTTRVQDEIQSAHWAQDQVTLHPIVCYYGNTTHEMVFVSDDVKHDNHFVETCFEKAVKQLPVMQKVVQFTDGCGAQYKSKSTFLDISKRMGMERHFFGSGHGKGPADACSGVVKSAVTRYVKGGGIISDAKDLKTFADKKLKRDTDTFKRSFHLIHTSDIKRDRENIEKVHTVKGTRKLHSVRGMSYGKIATRILSCTCDKCLGLDDNHRCPSADYVTEWTEEDLLFAKESRMKGKASKNCQKTKKKPEKRPSTKNGSKKSRAAAKQKGKESKKQRKHTSQRDIGKENSKITTVEYEVDQSALPVEANSNVEIDIKVNSLPLSVSEYQTMLEILGNSRTLQDLQVKALEFVEKLPELHSHENFTIVENSLTVDKSALAVLPEEIAANLFPVTVIGDGNCLPRTGSVLLSGTEDDHVEIRLRIVIELAINNHCYINSDYLRVGTDITDKEAEKLPTSFVMYSSVYTPGDVISNKVVERTLFGEILMICRLKEYMGIWQIFGLSSVLARPIMSVYPNLGNPAVRKDLNRCILPRKCVEQKPVYIMWSSNRTNEMTKQHWVPNHFCPLLKMSSGDPDQFIDTSMTDTSASSEQIEEIIQMLFSEDTSEDTCEAAIAQLVSEASGIMIQPIPSVPLEEEDQPSTSVPLEEVDQPSTSVPLEEVDQPSTSVPLEEIDQPSAFVPLEEVDQPSTSVLLKEVDQPIFSHKRISRGSYVAVKHGQKTLPAVIEEWPWVIFFAKAGKKWTPSRLSHTVLIEDIVGELSPSNIEAKGSRVYYEFELP